MSSQGTKIPCEFARDCLTPDGEYCPKYPDPDDCEKYHRMMVLEEEEPQEEFEAWLSNKLKQKCAKKTCITEPCKNKRPPQSEDGFCIKFNDGKVRSAIEQKSKVTTT